MDRETSAESLTCHRTRRWSRLLFLLARRDQIPNLELGGEVTCRPDLRVGHSGCSHWPIVGALT
jgi:hypothetical protein